jgi:hypothetical protein
MYYGGIGMEVIIGQSAEIIERDQAIRYQVSTVEQNIPNELDFDGLDPCCRTCPC